MWWLGCSCISIMHTCCIQNWQKEPICQICVIVLSNFGNSIKFGPPRITYLFYIWTTLFITVHTFTVGNIALHVRTYAILLHLAWLNSKKLGFTLFLLYSHTGWTATLVRCLLSTTPMCSTVNCTSATSYNYYAKIFFLNCTTMNKWRNNSQ